MHCNGEISDIKLNADIPVLRAADKSNLFRKVNADAAEIVLAAEKLNPKKDNVYIADDEELHNLACVKKIGREVFAELPIQAGWCYGGGKSMNGVEWHKSSEVVVAACDCVLVLGDARDIEDDTFDSAKGVALSLKRGEAVELSPMTLHLAPLAVGEYFKAAILLPRGTNAPLEGGIDGTLRAVNKWLLVHPDNKRGIELGGKTGVTGVNISVI